jgi:O-acetyl-ADP-ribose deacetylase (regulator of RNase III)
MRIKINDKVIALVQGDITAQDTDAIVNAANSALILGAGVAGAIRTRGGPAIQEACDRIGGCPVGGAVITTGGNLPAHYVIHAVGPRMGEGNEDEKLRNATQNSLIVASENSLQNIAFPAISTGIFGFPMDRCTDIMISETMDFLQGETSLELVLFCLYDSAAFKVFEEKLAEYSE